MLKRILNKENLDRKDIIFLLGLEEQNDIATLINHADEVRKKFCGDDIHLRGIIDISNYCGQNCLYCGLRKSNAILTRFKMSFDEIISTAEYIINSGIRTVVLQSGETDLINCEEITRIVAIIKEKEDCAVTLSLGERKFEDYAEWKAAGADRYLLKHETANKDKYFAHHSGDQLSERLEHLYFLKNIGYQVGSGNIIGLPGQSIDDIADDILLCRDIDVDMVSVSPFISSPHTPYRNIPSPNLDLTLKAMAAARIVLKNVHLPATSAFSVLYPDRIKLAFQAGANVIMPNFTPSPYRENYSIYPKKFSGGSMESTLVSLRELAESIGRRISDSKGESLKKIGALK